jgi:hypothetical protein
MGYTHYWKFTMNPKDIKDGEKKFKNAVKLLKKCLAKLPERVETDVYDSEKMKYVKELIPLRLAGGMGTGEPEFSDTKVWFNGYDDGVNDFSHETCAILLDDPNDYSFNFCKTAEKPYDVAVCLTLICFKKAFGDDFNYSSDGRETENDGWVNAHRIFDSVR